MSIDQVTVTKPVDGTVKRRTRGKGKPKVNGPVVSVTLDRRVLAAARTLITGGSYTRYEIVSATEAVVR